MSQDDEKGKVLDFMEAKAKRDAKKEAEKEAKAQEESENDPRIQLLQLATDSAKQSHPMVLVVATEEGINLSTTVRMADAYLLLALGQEILRGTATGGEETIH